jgi:hypothetical protein
MGYLKKHASKSLSQFMAGAQIDKTTPDWLEGHAKSLRQYLGDQGPDNRWDRRRR